MALPWNFLVASLVVCTTFLLITTATGDEIYENRGIKSGNGGSRYGRSQSDLSMDSYGKTNNRLVPRNDKFFFGSRYGKRSAAPIAALDEGQNQALTCFYTGITNLFRCVEKTDPQQNMEEDK